MTDRKVRIEGSKEKGEKKKKGKKQNMNRRKVRPEHKKSMSESCTGSLPRR